MNSLSPYAITRIAARDLLRSIPRRLGLVRRKPLSDSTRKLVYLRDGARCYLCGGHVQWSDLHVDHRWPWIRGGGDEVRNLRTTHEVCNLRKGAKTL